MKDMNFRLVTRTQDKEPKTSLEGYSLHKAQSVREFHKSFPMYAPTPLVSLPETAKAMGIGDLHQSQHTSNNHSLSSFVKEL